jgi:flagellar hook-basal body complex protein FliE
MFLQEDINDFLNESGKPANLTATGEYRYKLDSFKEKIKKNWENANKAQEKSQEYLEKGDADKASIETLKYKKYLTAVQLAQADYKLFIKQEALKKEAEANKE